MRALTADEARRAILREGTKAVPVMLGHWWGEGLEDAHRDALAALERDFPQDICLLWYHEPGYEASSTDNPDYRFGYLEDYSDAEVHGTGRSHVLLPDWGDLDRFLADLPDPNEPGNFAAAEAEAARDEGRLRIGCWWRLFHERFWSIRGMENMMMDYYDHMEELGILGRALIDYYKVIIRRYHDLGCRAIFSSDDLGHQRGPMMSPEHFRALYVPLYEELIDYIHSLDMALILHSCGDNTLLLDDLVAVGLDVFHPVQKGTMDMEATAARYAGRLGFFVGFDVQHELIHMRPEEVTAEVERLAALYRHPSGGLLMGAGNGIMPGTPVENIRAMLEAMYRLSPGR